MDEDSLFKGETSIRMNNNVIYMLPLNMYTQDVFYRKNLLPLSSNCEFLDYFNLIFRKMTDTAKFFAYK